MFDPKIINQLTKQFKDSLPPPFKDVNEEIEKNFRQLLQTAFSELQLVTREEFDVQTEVLARTREKLIELEKQITFLEEKLKSSPL